MSVKYNTQMFISKFVDWVYNNLMVEQVSGFHGKNIISDSYGIERIGCEKPRLESISCEDLLADAKRLILFQNHFSFFLLTFKLPENMKSSIIQ
jgi:hypothetical protein